MASCATLHPSMSLFSVHEKDVLRYVLCERLRTTTYAHPNLSADEATVCA